MSRAAVIFGERIITQSSEYGVHSAGTGTSGNGWIGIGTATGAQAPRHSAIPIAMTRGFTRAIVTSGAPSGNASKARLNPEHREHREKRRARRGGPQSAAPSGRARVIRASLRYRDRVFIESAGAIFVAII